MPKPASIEDAPHHLKLLNDYGKTAVALSLALLSLSVTFAEKLIKPPVDWVQATLLGGLWICLLLALIGGLMITGCLTGVASNYMKALRTAYPDALTELSAGKKIKVVEDPSEEIEITNQQEQSVIKTALQTSYNRTIAANSWATFSFWMFGLSSFLIAALGFYGSIYRGMHIDASAAVKSSVDFVVAHYKLSSSDAQFSSLTYDETKKTYTVGIKNKQNPQENHEIMLDSSSGNVTQAKKSP